MICPRSHKKLISVETEIEPTLSDSPKGLGTNVPIFFLHISLSFTFVFDISGSIFLHPFFVNPQKLYRVTIAGHTPYKISAMYKAIAILTQSPELGQNKLTPCPIIHSFLLFDVIYMSAKGLMANFKYKER